MKKIIVLLIFCFLIAGCEEQLVPDLRDTLMPIDKISADWIDKYGDGFESQQTANIALAIQIINNQGEAIKQLDSRLAALEDPNNINLNK